MNVENQIKRREGSKSPVESGVWLQNNTYETQEWILMEKMAAGYKLQIKLFIFVLFRSLIIAYFDNNVETWHGISHGDSKNVQKH